MIKTLDPYTKKEYECRKCNRKVYYAKLCKEDGTFYTNDGENPNGKFGKDNNVVSVQVDVNNKEQVHNCAMEFVTKKMIELDKKYPTGNSPGLTRKETQILQSSDDKPIPKLDDSEDLPKHKEMDVADFAEPALRAEIRTHIKLLRIIEDEVNKELGDSNGNRVGMFINNVRIMLSTKIDVEKPIS